VLMQTPKYILWDHDGVLVDTEEWFFQATRRGLAEIDVTISRIEYQRIRAHGTTAWPLARKMGISREKYQQHRAHRDALYQEYLKTEPIEIEMVENILEQLKDHCRMAIVTTSKRTDFELIHRSRSLLKHMAFTLTVEDYAREKPAPDPYLAALKRFGIGPEEALVVEDSEQGLRSAKAAGLECIIIRNHFFDGSHDFGEARAVLDSIRELPGSIGLKPA